MKSQRKKKMSLKSWPKLKKLTKSKNRVKLTKRRNLSKSNTFH